MQQALLSTTPAPRPVQGGPVFGVQASWLCFRQGIAAAFDEDRRINKSFLLPDPSDYADLAFLYLSQANPQGPDWRISCPALGFDEAGEYKDVFIRFIQTADKAAQARTGLAYGEGDTCVTTSWKGETAAEKTRENTTQGDAPC